MASVNFPEERLTEEQDPVEAPPSASIQSAANLNAWDDAAQEAIGGDGSHYWSDTYAKLGGHRSAGRVRRPMFLILIAVLIPAVIISLLRAVCRVSVSASTNRASGASIRRLSDSEENKQEDDSLSQLIEACAAMEAELGIPVSQDSNPAQALDTAEQVARMAYTLYHEAMSFEQEMQQSQPAGHTAFRPLAPSPPSSGVQPLEGLMLMLEQQRAAEGQQHSPGYTTPELQGGSFLSELLDMSPPHIDAVSQPLNSGLHSLFASESSFSWVPQSVFGSSQPEYADSQSGAGPQPTVPASETVSLHSQTAALLPQDVGQRSSKGASNLETLEGAYPDLNPDAWLDDLPMIGISPEEEMQSHAYFSQEPPAQQEMPCSSAACQFASVEPQAGASDQVAVSAGGAGAFAAASAPTASPETSAVHEARTTAAGGASNDWILRHPYVHLPTLQEGVSSPPIQLSSLSFQALRGTGVREVLLSLRYVLSRDSLSQRDAVFLAGSVYELARASGARARMAKRMVRPLHGVVNIGQQFLVLDAMVSAMHVLGESPRSWPWWEAFAKCFDTNYHYGSPGRRTQESGAMNIVLANRMLKAMDIYKTGNRPDPEEILLLKYLLFFSPHTPARFKNSMWDLWRNDHTTFVEQHPEVSDWFEMRKQSLPS